VTGGPPVRGGGGMPQRISTISQPGPGIAYHGGRVVAEHARHRRQIANIAVDHAEERDDGSLVGGDRVKIGLYFFPSEELIEFKISLKERFR
jgi:hypothetical protein